MQKVEPMRNMDLLILGLNPSKLVYHFIPPFVQAFISDMHLGVKDPKKAEALSGQDFNGDVHDF